MDESTGNPPSQQTTQIRVKGINKRRAVFYKQQNDGCNMIRLSDDSPRQTKRRKMLEDEGIFKVCLLFVKGKMLSNKELETYLSQNDDGEYKLLGIAYVESQDEAKKNALEYRYGLEFAHQPFQYWRKYSSKFPLLSAFAARHLGVCSSSVASERLLSQAKKIINSERARLETDTAEKLVLMNAWVK